MRALVCLFAAIGAAMVSATSLNGLAQFWPPVVHIPGGLVSNLQVQVTPAASTSCAVGTFVYLGNLNGQNPPQSDQCVADALTQVYDAETDCYHDPHGVTVTTYQPGTRNAIVNDGTRLNLFSTWDQLGLDVKVLPYDYRYDPNYLLKCTNWRAQAKSFIEDLATKGQHIRPVLVVSHSCGPSYWNIFLDSMPQSWKDQYIFGHVILDDDQMGETDIFLYITSALGNLANLTPSLDFQMINSWSFVPYYMADRHVYADTVCVQRPSPCGNVSCADLGPLLSQAGYDAQFVSLFDNKNETYPHPGVKIACFAGHGDPLCPKTLIYNSCAGFDITNAPDDSNCDEGDSGQNFRTNLGGCLRWLAVPGTVHPTLMPHNHTPDLLGSLDTWETIFDRVVRPSAYPDNPNFN